MNTLKESLLSKTQIKVSAASETIDKETIKDKLINSGWYQFLCKRDADPDTYLNIYKKYGKWVVDVDCGMNCYGTQDGYVTDGSFRFGTINGEYNISSEPTDREKSHICDLKYGPVRVEGGFSIFGNDKLKNLKDCPKYVLDGIIIHDTNITTLKYFPIYCAGSVYISNNKQLKTVTDTKFANIEAPSVAFKDNGFVSTELTKRDLKWEIKSYGRYGFRFDKSIAAPEFNK